MQQTESKAKPKMVYVRDAEHKDDEIALHYLDGKDVQVNPGVWYWSLSKEEDGPPAFLCEPIPRGVVQCVNGLIIKVKWEN